MRITLPQAESTLIDRQCILKKSQNIPPPLKNSTFIPAPSRKSGLFAGIFCWLKSSQQKNRAEASGFLLFRMSCMHRQEQPAEIQTVLPRFSAWEVDKSRKTNQGRAIFCFFKKRRQNYELFSPDFLLDHFAWPNDGNTCIV